MVAGAEKALEILEQQGIRAALWDVRSCAPLDPAMIADAAGHRVVVTVEDGVRSGGIGMNIADEVHALESSVKVENLGLPVRFIQQGKPERLLAQLGLDGDGIAASIRAVALS